MNRFRRWFAGMSIVESCAVACLIGLGVTVVIATARTMPPLHIGAIVAGVLLGVTIMQSLEKW